ncbi:hypothetical protein TVNIR_0287 [Thioalkalivibrio nitratireducens DSM 14787]|uniref:Uncharacterized protein n=1 Tax=Thioalkalivibrio nitratireducens (strain DSM 14787 / UNIQEM 213 / ALEN2) TaxID=1255043 RepID=L0DSL4_THIND|nr:hypothetical protein TVNIR_0287 [Thioalkalivibrio nitratireducens DSM 14787]
MALVAALGIVASLGSTAVAQPFNPPGHELRAPTPVQLHLRGGFQDGSINLFDSGIGVRSYTVPDGAVLRLTYVSCRAISNDAQHVQIFFSTTAETPGMISPLRVVELLTEGFIENQLPQRRAVVSGPVDAWLGIETPGGPIIGSTLTLNAQRDTNQGTGGVECAVAGELTG